jgi:hypothetical protein
VPALRVTPLLHSTSGWLRASAAGSELRGKRHAKFAGCGIRSADTSTLRRRAVVSLVTGRRKPADREIEGRSESPAVASFCLGFPATDLLFSGVHTHTHVSVSRCIDQVRGVPACSTSLYAQTCVTFTVDSASWRNDPWVYVDGVSFVRFCGSERGSHTVKTRE